MLKLSSSAENAYQLLKSQRDKEKAEKLQEPEPLPELQPEPQYLDDVIPF